MIEEVWRRVSAARCLDRLVIATEDRRVHDVARGFGAEVMLTDAAHRSGTDRVAEVARRSDAEFAIVVNVQGDEPLVTPGSLDRLVAALGHHTDADLATLAEPIDDVESLFDPNVVKVVTAGDGRALYFSRSPIPYHRAAAGPLGLDFREALGARGLAGFRRHQGIYAYRRPALMRLAQLPPSPLEIDEALEQLRALEAGFVIAVVESDFRSQGVDTPADLARVARILAEAR
jgi:3-deoxy-manno-octulosonate cytidylyltransferase (CMP-KDO synthetase)